MEKKRLELAVMPEEYKSLARLADIVEQLLQEQRDEAHKVYLQQRKAAREQLAPQLFELPLDVLAVSQEVLDILEPFGNIGEVMLICAVDEALISRKFADLEDEPMAELRTALDIINAADLDQLLAEAFSIEEDDEEAATDEAVEAQAEETSVDEPAEEAVAEEEEADTSQPEVMLDAFGQPVEEDRSDDVTVASGEAEAVIVEPAVPVETPVVEAERQREARSDEVVFVEEEGEREFELDRQKGKQQRRKDRQRRRQLVLDEKSGEVIAKRRRKGRRGSWDEETWEDYDY